jgi:hypothetical protein
MIYAVLVLIFYRALVRSRRASLGAGVGEQALEFTWNGFCLCFVLATLVTALARLWLYRFAVFQIAAFFSFYVLAGLALLAGTILYVLRREPEAGTKP